MVLPPVLWVLARQSHAAVPQATRRLAFAVRVAVLFLLTLALAGPHAVQRSHDLTTVFVLDVSKSIRPEQRAAGLRYISKALSSKPNGDSAGIITFGRTANIDDAPSATLDNTDGLQPTVAADATDLTGALRLASGAFPMGRAARLSTVRWQPERGAGRRRRNRLPAGVRHPHRRCAHRFRQR